MIVHLQSSFEDYIQHRDYDPKTLQNWKLIQFKEHFLWDLEVNSNPSKSPLLLWLHYFPAPGNSTGNPQVRDRIQKFDIQWSEIFQFFFEHAWGDLQTPSHTTITQFTLLNKFYSYTVFLVIYFFSDRGKSIFSVIFSRVSSVSVESDKPGRFFLRR